MIETKIRFFMSQLQSLRLSFTQQDAIEQELRINALAIVSNIAENAIREISNTPDEGVLEHIELTDRNGYPQLSSDTGSFNFVRPEWHMLSSLLKNAKVSAAGHRYKVIPVGKDGGMTGNAKDIESGISSMHNSSPMENITADIVHNFNSGATKVVREKSKRTSGKTEFRTASDKQDPSASWVLPEKKTDVEIEVSYINSRIITQIDDEVENLFRRKREELGL